MKTTPSDDEVRDLVRFVTNVSRSYHRRRAPWTHAEDMESAALEELARVMSSYDDLETVRRVVYTAAWRACVREHIRASRDSRMSVPVDCEESDRGADVRRVEARLALAETAARARRSSPAVQRALDAVAAEGSRGDAARALGMTWHGVHMAVRQLAP